MSHTFCSQYIGRWACSGISLFTGSSLTACRVVLVLILLQGFSWNRSQVFTILCTVKAIDPLTPNIPWVVLHSCS